MGALSYYLLKRTKNQLVQFVHSPGKVIYALILCFAVITSFSSGPSFHYGDYRSINEFYALLWVIYTFVFITVSKNGFSNGSALFSMADVNLLFVSPVKNTRILIFAMLQQLSRSLLVGVILLLQYNNVSNYYEISYGEFLLAVLFYGLTVFFSHMLSVMLYTFCCNNEKRASFVKAVYYAIIIAFILFAFVTAFTAGKITVDSVVASLNKDLFSFFPVSGYLVMLFKGITVGETSFVVTGMLMFLIFVCCFIFSVTFRKFDFYDNVITSAELTDNMGGSTPSETAVTKKIRVGKTGFTRGFGADVIYEKNKIENRRSRVMYIDMLTVVYAVINVICAFIFDSSLWIVFAAGIYILMFSVTTGRWVRELKNPYIYLIPEKSSKKIFSMLKEQLPTQLIQSVIVFLPLLLMKFSISEVLSLALARFGFALLFIGVTLAMKNLFSTTDKGAFYGFIYLVLCFVVSLPSVVAAFFVYMFYVFNYEFALISMFAVNTAVGALIVLMNKNLLDKGM